MRKDPESVSKRKVFSNTLVAFVLATMAAGAGCSDEPSQVSSLAELGVEDGASAGVSASALVTRDRDAVLELSTGARVTVPKGAVPRDVTLGIERPKDEVALAMLTTVDKGKRIASAPYVVTPHGTPFDTEVEVTLPVSKERNQARLKVMWLKDEADQVWKELGKPDITNGRATIKVLHFSVLVLVEEDAAGTGVDVEPGNRDAGASVGDTGRGDAGASVMDAGASVIDAGASVMDAGRDAGAGDAGAGDAG